MEKKWEFSDKISNLLRFSHLYTELKQDYNLTYAVGKACQGDTNALSWLYDQYADEMFITCWRMIGNKDQAEDVLQDSFITAFSKLGQLKDRSQFRSWLKKIVINNCLNIRQREKRPLEFIDDYYDSPEEVEVNWMEGISIENIYDEIFKLPQGCRQVFSLFVFEDYSHQQIAALLNISLSTSKSQYHRARQLLKKALTQQYNGSL